MFTTSFWKQTAERVISSAAETAIPVFMGANAWDIDYRAAAGITAASAVVTFLKCVVATQVGDKGTPSLTRA